MGAWKLELATCIGVALAHPAIAQIPAESSSLWEPTADTLAADGFHRLTLPLPVAAEVELVFWAQAEDPARREPLVLRLATTDGPALGEHRSTPSDPVAVLVHDGPLAADLVVELQTRAAEPVRYGWSTLPLPPERRARLDSLRAALEDLEGLDAPGQPAVRSALQGLLHELLGRAGHPQSWAGSQLARELGERAGRSFLDDLAAECFGVAAAFREELLPPTSRHVLELRLLEARALARTSRGSLARAQLEALLPRLDALHGEASNLVLATRQDLALCLRNLGDLEGARDLYLETVDRATRGLAPAHFEQIRLRHNAAVACYELGDYWRSLQLDQEALERLRARTDPIPDFERAIRLQLALTTRRLGTSVPAFEEQHRRILSQLEAELGPTHEDVLRLKSNLAGLLTDEGRPAPALPWAEEVLAARLERLGPLHADSLQAKLRVAQVLGGLGRVEEGLALQREVLAAAAPTRPPGDALVHQAHRALVRSLRRLDRREEAEAQALAWIATLTAAVESSLVASWRERRERLTDLRRELSGLARAGSEEEYGPAWQAAFFELLETIRAAGAAGPLRTDSELAGGELGALFEARAAARQRLAGDVAQSVSVESRTQVELDALVEARHALDRSERELARALEARDLLPFRAVDVGSLARALGPRAAAFSFHTFDRSLARPLGSGGYAGADAELPFHASLLTSDGRLRSRLVPSLCELEGAIADWRAAVGVPVDERPVPPARERRAAELDASARILGILFGPWLGELPASVDTLYVCLEGAPLLVPLDALTLAPGRLLGERHRVRPLVALDALLLAPAPSPAPPRFVGVGGLDYGDPQDGVAARFHPLPDGEAEVRRVAALFEAAGAEEARVLLGAAGTREAVGAALVGASHALLATHGTFEEELLANLDASVGSELSREQLLATLAPLSLARIALSGANLGAQAGENSGIWTGEELAALDLRSLDLCVLSACDTNRSLRRGGEGVLSLQTALHAAGAQRSLTSLWRVKSDYGRELVVRFFEELLAGASATEALWEAKRYLREERGLPTRFWAGWILGGDR